MTGEKYCDPAPLVLDAGDALSAQSHRRVFPDEGGLDFAAREILVIIDGPVPFEFEVD